MCHWWSNAADHATIESSGILVPREYHKQDKYSNLYQVKNTKWVLFTRRHAQPVPDAAGHHRAFPA
jgi:hypothetical protein